MPRLHSPRVAQQTTHTALTPAHPPPAARQLGFYLLQAPAVEHRALRLTLECVYAAVCVLVAGSFLKSAGTDPADAAEDEAPAAAQALFCSLCCRTVRQGLTLVQNSAQPEPF